MSRNEVDIAGKDRLDAGDDRLAGNRRRFAPARTHAGAKTMSGRLIGIARVAALRAPPEEIAFARVSVEAGIDGDARGKKRDRQVTILFRESWDDACRELGVALPWTTRRANLLVEGLPPPQQTRGKLRIGDVTLEVRLETDPCMLMERMHNGLKAALTPAWRGGVCCNVVTGGDIRLGNPVTLS